LVFIRGKPTPIILVDLMNGKYRFGVLWKSLDEN
jgi:DNA-binding HxlR family transcriptional regulator